MAMLHHYREKISHERLLGLSQYFDTQLMKVRSSENKLIYTWLNLPNLNFKGNWWVWHVIQTNITADTVVTDSKHEHMQIQR